MNIGHNMNKDFLEALSGKRVVVDTSSLLFGGVSLIEVMPKSHLVIPSIVVSELERNRTKEQVGVFAREWLRLIDSLSRDFGDSLSKGVDFKNITISVEPNHTSQDSLPPHLRDGSNDSTILAVAYNFKKEGENVVILSNDVPMRIHARLDLKIDSYEVSSSEIFESKPFSGRRSISLTSDEYSEFLKDEEMISEVIDRENLEDDSSHILYEILVEGETVDSFMWNRSELSRVQLKTRVSGIVARSREQNVLVKYLQEPSSKVPIVSVGGGAGTGKTLMTIASGLDEVKAGSYGKIMVFRSLHEMGKGQEMGFLPGSVEEKIAPWAGAIHDAVETIASKSVNVKDPNARKTKIEKKVESLLEMIEVSPITYLRGRSIANTFIILEEAQNFSRTEILNILSRAGEGSKIVLTFDAQQVDSRYLQSGSKAEIWSVIDDLRNSDLFAHITLEKVERSAVSKLASSILEG